MKEYIERAKLMDHIELNAREHGESYDAWQILGDVEDFPAADVVERKRGEWMTRIDEDEEWGKMEYPECSLCKRSAFMVTDFCPNCGADMREGDHEP